MPPTHDIGVSSNPDEITEVPKQKPGSDNLTAVSYGDGTVNPTLQGVRVDWDPEEEKAAVRR